LGTGYVHSMYVDPVVGAHLLHALCTGLLTGAVVALWRRQNNLPAVRDRRLTSVETGLDECMHRIRVLHGKLARVSTRKSDEPDDDDADDAPRRGGLGDTRQRKGETAEQWKARMRLQLANGGLKHD
jgi:hypothetical protein